MATNENTTSPPQQHDEQVREALENYIAGHGLTHADMAKTLGFSATRITKYLNLYKPENKPEPDMRKVEAAARAFIRHATRRADFRSMLFDNDVTTDVATILKQVRRTGDVGLIHGRAGVGKTCGAELFCRDNPLALFTTARKYACGSNAIESMLFEELINSIEIPYPGNMPRMLWMEQVLRGTERLIIIDNAQRLHISAFQLLMDLHDATMCAIGLIGNPEVLDILRRNDQLFSRIGIVYKIKSQDEKDSESTVKKLISQFAPGAEKDLLEPGIDVLSRLGAARTLKKQLTLASSIREGGKCDWMSAFQQAAELLVKPTSIPGRLS